MQMDLNSHKSPCINLNDDGTHHWQVCSYTWCDEEHQACSYYSQVLTG